MRIQSPLHRRSSLFRPTTLPLALLLGVAAAGSIHAANIAKADNSTALNLGASYVGGVAPGTGDILEINSTLTADRSAPLGGNLSIDGILFTASATRSLTIGNTVGATLTIGGSGITIAAPTGANLSINSNIALSANQTWNFGVRNATFGATSTINEAGFNLAITGSNTLTFSSTTAQTLNAALTYNSGAVNVTGSSVLTLTNTTNRIAALSISGSSTVVTSNLTVTGTQSTLGAGATSMNNGTVRYTGNTATSSQSFVHDSRADYSRIEVANAGQTLTLTTNLTTSALTSTNTNNSWELGGTGNLVISGTILNSSVGANPAVRLTKVGSGTLTLSATNTYTGATTVSAGTLLVNGRLANSAAADVTVSALAALGGTGRIDRAVLVDGQLTPGNGGVGTLTVANDVTWNGSLSNTWKFELGAVSGSSDLVFLTGAGNDFLKGTGTDFVFDFQNTGVVGTFTLINWDSTTTFLASDFNYTGLSNGLTGSFAINGSQLDFVVTAVPEPAAGLLAAMGMAFVFGARRREKR